LHVTDTEQLPWEETVNSRTGAVYRKFIREGEVLPGQSYYIRLSKFTSENGPFTAPRHKHDFDQIRVVLTGKSTFGRGFESTAGCAGYFPSGTSYGPEYIEDSEMLVIQWGPKFIPKAVNDAAITKLSERGRFHEGFYELTRDDGSVEKIDSLRAIWEEVYRRPIEIPSRRYAQMVLMDANEFTWSLDRDGLEYKHLARFGADDLGIDHIRWPETQTLVLPADRTALVFVLSGSVEANGAAHGPRTAIFSDFGEEDSLRAASGTEVLRINFPLEVTAAPARHQAAELVG
jgi:hypothetical protein